MSLTLNMTPGSDNEAIFLLNVFAEGNNLVLNSDFDAATGWTEGGDWVIGSNQASYTYVDDATGDLDQTLVAAEAVEYILEYTVKSVTGTGFNFYLRGGIGLYSSLQIELDRTIGKHSIVFLGTAAATTFGLGCANFGASDEIIIDDVKVKKKEDVIYLSTRDITLDSTVYDGKVLAFNRVGDMTQYVDAEIGGGIGAVTGIDFAIARHTLNTRASSFFNEFFPAYNGGMVVARAVMFGVVWNTATTLAEITWLFKGRVINYIPDQRQINFIVLQETEFDNSEVPFYFIQKDNDNKVSYFPNVANEDLGSIIPIIYGDFSGGTLTQYRNRLIKLSPAILINANKDQILVANHKCDTVSYNQLITNESIFYKRIDNVYQAIYNNGNTAYANNDIRHTITMQDTAEGDVKGVCYIPLNQLSDYSSVQDITNILDYDITNYVELDGGQTLAMKVGTSFNSSDFGALGVLQADVQIVFQVSTDGGGNREVVYGYYNKTLSVPAGDTDTVTLTLGTKVSEELEFGNSVLAKRDAIIPWTIEELCNLEFSIKNNEAAGSKVYVYEIYLYLTNIIVSGYSTRYKAVTRAGRGGDLYGYNPINPRRDVMIGNVLGGYTRYISPDNTKTALSNLFAYVKGREFGRWIDHILAADASKNRTTGHIEGGLVENPIYIIESLFRDEKFVERDLQITSTADTTHFVCSNVLVKSDDYYNYAEFFNATNLLKRNITDYVGSTNIFTINAADTTPMAAGDNFFLTNIQGDYRIDYASFDVIGNTTNGTRKDWKFARSINTKQSFQSIIDELLYESHCVLFESADEDTGQSKMKVKALDKVNQNIGTLASPIKALEGGRIEQVKNSLTDLGQAFTSFKLFYHFDVGKGDYLKSILVDKNGYSNPSGGTTLTDEHMNLCAFAEKNYRINNPYAYSSNWIYDDATAEYFLDKKIKWFTEQRLKVRWTAPLYASVTNAAISWELGDTCHITYTKGLPAEYEYRGSLGESHVFMITGKEIIVNPQGTPHIILDLIDLGI